jgi:hypothetical protein
MFSIAAIWLALSELFLPAAYLSSAPSRFASAVAPSFILTKNGFVTSFVINPTLTLSCPLPAAATVARTALPTRTTARADISSRPVERASLL